MKRIAAPRSLRPGGPVPDPGDLALVGHQRDEPQLRAALDLPGQGDGVGHGVDRGAFRADLDPPSQRPPAGVDVDADPDRRRRAAQHRLDQLEMLDAIDHHHRRLIGVGGAADRQLGQSVAVGRRVGEQEVLEALRGEPERLGQGEREQPGEPLAAGEDPLQKRPGAHRLAGQADRLAAGPAGHVGGVRPHRVEIDEGERSLDLGEGPLVAAVGLLRGRHGGEPTSRPRRFRRAGAVLAPAQACQAAKPPQVFQCRRGVSAAQACQAAKPPQMVSNAGAVLAPAQACQAAKPPQEVPLLQSGARRGGRVAEGTRLLSE